jgi:hypothetical protein
LLERALVFPLEKKRKDKKEERTEESCIVKVDTSKSEW